MTVVLIDYGAGNLRSAVKGFERVARETNHDQPIVLTTDPEVVARADRLVLPGDGAFPDCRRGLSSIDGMDEAIRAFVASGRPFLGICVGMQLIASRGLEHETADGFGWIPGEVRLIEPPVPAQGERPLKVPHMGWNTLDRVHDHPILDGVTLGPNGLHAYFLHSYAFEVTDARHLIATADYGRPVTAIVARDNIVGTQFHPEKSQTLGLRMLANFLAWAP
jgi:glutamine amidotransferase